MKMDDYFFADKKGQIPVIVPTNEPYRLVGCANGREGFEDGTVIVTSFIEEHNTQFARTASGSIYELGEMSPDYFWLINASRTGTPIVTDWLLKKEVLFDKTPEITDLGETASINTHTGFLLTGKTKEGKTIVGEIIRQSGNTVTLVVFNKKSYKEEEITVFVLWPYPAKETEFYVALTGEVAGLKSQDFEEAFHSKCRPKIPLLPSNKIRD